MLETYRTRLGARILLLMALVMVASSLAFLAIFAPLHHAELLREREAVVQKLGAALQIALQRAMLKRDLDGLREMVADLGQTPNVRSVVILNPQGVARFSSNPQIFGRSYDLDAACVACRPLEGESVRAGFMRDESGQEVMRSLRAVRNQPQCVGCHGAISAHPINGYLLIDYAASDLKSNTWIMAGGLSAAGLFIVLGALAATWLALRTFVIEPVRRLAEAVKDFGQMNFKALREGSSAMEGREDEIAQLGRGFEKMAAKLESAIQDMRARDAFQQALIDAIPDGVRVVADDYSVIAANAEFCRQSGMSLQEVMAAPCYRSSHGRKEPCIPTLTVCPLVETRASEELVKCSHTHLNERTQTQFAVEVAAAAMKPAPGQPRMVVESIRDLSRAVRISQEQRLSELGQLAAGVAHEIHNPLASIRLGLTAIQRKLENGELDAEMSGFMSAVNVEVDRCLTTTDRLMRLSRIPDERGGLVDLERCVRDAAFLLQYEAELRRIEIQIEAEEETRIIAAEGDVGMIVINLMQNAMHAMPNGGVLKAIVRHVCDNDEVEMAILDQGVGIAAENQEKIFHPFWSRRADGSLGSGLGLAICKALLEKWGGRISVRSAVGEGSTFTTRFPDADQTMGFE